MITTRNLTKTFDEFTAVENLSLNIEKGETYALLGPLGCGNSCVIKMLATLIPPTRGEASIAGHDLRRNPNTAREHVGYMPDLLGAYDDMRVAECLRMYALGHGMEAAAAEKRITQLLMQTEIEGDDYIEKLDTEQRRRLGLARALLHDPEVLLLDKPAAGLDLAARARFFTTLRAVRARAARPLTLLLSSNLLSDALGLCDRIGVMLHGRLIAEGPCEAITRKLAPHRIFELELHAKAESAAAWLRGQPTIRFADAQGGYLIFTVNGQQEPTMVLKGLAEAGFPATRWREHEIDFDSLVTPAEKAFTE